MSKLDKVATTTIRFDSAVISFGGTNYTVPATTIIYSPSATVAETIFVNGEWQTTVPVALAGNAFLSGLALPVSANLPGGINPVTWTGTFRTNARGAELKWKWAAAVYTQFASSYGAAGVKPVDGSKYSPYNNSDKAGTPEDYRNFVTAGARGGGGSNYTGGYSGTASVKCP